MRYNLLPQGLAVFLLLVSISAADENQPEKVTNLIHGTQWVQFEIVSGRIQSQRAQYVKSKSVAVRNSFAGVDQSFAAEFEDRFPAVHYEWIDATEDFRVEMVSNQLEIHRTFKQTETPIEVRYFQSKDATQQLSVRKGDDEQHFRAPTFWHLMLAEPQVCETYLLPLLDRLHRDWHLADLAHNVEEALLQFALRETQLSQRTFDEVVRQLGDDRYVVRQAADRRLRGLGRLAVSYLLRLDLAGLNAEQRLRVQRLRDDLATELPDTPHSVAVEFAGDPAVFVILLDRTAASTRATAAAHLTTVLDQKLEFDPHASLAERSRQLELVCRRLGVSNPQTHTAAKPVTPNLR